MLEMSGMLRNWKSVTRDEDEDAGAGAMVEGRDMVEGGGA